MSIEDFNIVFPKPHLMRAPSVSDSFAAADSSYGDSPRGEVQNIGDDESMHPSQPSQIA